MSLVQARAVKLSDCLQTTSGKAGVKTAIVQGHGISSVVIQAGDLVVVIDFAATPFSINHRIGDIWYVIHRATIYSLRPSPGAYFNKRAKIWVIWPSTSVFESIILRQGD